MSVANTEDFSLWEVVNVTGGNSLSQAFNNAVYGYFDPLYNRIQYAPDNSLKRFRNYGPPDFIGFDPYGIPMWVKTNLGDAYAQYASYGTTVVDSKCFAYTSDNKRGYAAGADGVLVVYDFSQVSIPAISYYSLNPGTALLFVRIFGDEIFVGDDLGRVYMSPSRYNPFFHRVNYSEIGHMSDMVELNGLIYGSNTNGRMFKYKHSTIPLPLYNDTFDEVFYTSVWHTCITANNTFVFGMSSQLDGYIVDYGISYYFWDQTSWYYDGAGDTFGTSSAATDGTNAYLVHCTGSQAGVGQREAWYVPSGSYTAVPMTQLNSEHSDWTKPLINVCGANGSVIFIYNDSFELMNGQGIDTNRYDYAGSGWYVPNYIVPF